MRPTAILFSLLILFAANPVRASDKPFAFHCKGNACHALAFLDEGSGCIVITNHGHRPVHITLSGGDITGDIQPGETYSKLSIHGCYGYYDGGETATFIDGPHG